MSCVDPCLTCSGSTFTSCTSCNPALSSSFILQASGHCLIEPTWYIQLACTCTLAVFILLPLIRKRALVMTKIFDIIQTIAFFKYINGYIYYRHNFLYLDMRAMNPWSEGWEVVTVSGDLVTPIFASEETFSNKMIRIGSIWAVVVLLVLLVGAIRICCREGKI